MSSSVSQPANTGERLKTSEYIGYAMGDTASNFFFKFFSIFLAYYYVRVWGIPEKALVVDDAGCRSYRCFHRSNYGH